MLNKLDLQAAARQKAQGFKVEARNLRLGGMFQYMDRSATANAAQTQGFIGAGQTALSGYTKG